MQALLPWQRVRVEGLSMTPTLLPGDWLLVRHGAPVRPGALVLARFRRRPELLVIKRAVAEQDGGWLLASDNAGQGSDSRQYGVADVLATAVRVWRRSGPVPAGNWWRSAARRWWGTAPREFSPPG
ncbi:MAG TPA: S24 family peptidase [Jatrophihabitans sp.]|jgi:SOS-response transcriptional repressor LexA|uniref:S24 family peptidase n=1 Tax=Jatrophihabitans sp. TaxID=1932789 RepID=UPI002EE512CC